MLAPSRYKAWELGRGKASGNVNRPLNRMVTNHLAPKLNLSIGIKAVAFFSSFFLLLGLLLLLTVVLFSKEQINFQK